MALRFALRILKKTLRNPAICTDELNKKTGDLDIGTKGIKEARRNTEVGTQVKP